MTNSQKDPTDPLDLERQVLGAMLLKPSSIQDIAQVIRPTDFTDAAHRHIWSAILAVDGRGSPVDPIALGDELKRSGHVDGLPGGEFYLLDIAAAADKERAFDDYPERAR